VTDDELLFRAYALKSDPKYLKHDEAWKKCTHGDLILSEAQKKIRTIFDLIRDPTFVVECSRQLGKTYFACYLADKTARENPGCQVRLATAFYVDIEPIIIPNYKKVLETCPDELQPKYKRATYTYPNGSQVILVGLDKNPNKLRGNRIRLIIIEEAGFVDSEKLKYVVESIIAGAQLREKDARTVLISTPPEEGQDHYFCEVADLMEIRGSYIKLTIDQSGLPPEAIRTFEAKLGGRQSIAFRREGLCERIVDQTRKLIQEWRDEYVEEPPIDEYFPYYHKYGGMDLGRVDKTALIFGYYDFKRACLYIQDELAMSGPDWTTITLKDELLKTEKSIWGEFKPYRRISDNNNPHLIQDLNSLHNVYFIETSKESLEAMVNELRVMVGAGAIRVSPKCKFTIGCLKYGVWDKHRKEFARSKAYGHFDHLAALIYLVRNLDKVSNPIPLDHNKPNHRAWLGGVKDQLHASANARALESALIPKKLRTNNKPKPRGF
jgi:hypothetical protein